MSTTTLNMLAVIQRDARRERSAGFFLSIARGDSPASAAYYSHPRAFYAPLELLRRGNRGKVHGISFDHYRRVARAAVEL
jgi:hypothetical protein